MEINEGIEIIESWKAAAYAFAQSLPFDPVQAAAMASVALFVVMCCWCCCALLRRLQVASRGQYAAVRTQAHLGADIDTESELMPACKPRLHSDDTMSDLLQSLESIKALDTATLPLEDGALAFATVVDSNVESPSKRLVSSNATSCMSSPSNDNYTF